MSRTGDTAPEQREDARIDQSTPVAVGAAVFALLLAASALLWTRFGESVYVERILGAIANCF
ncbi:hypothetical protein [Microbaculum marinum]|uniref:Uncharacterized protein n=1 Tax=Microbaculum marinum TaxID=1764581 RepID=A0AAW9RLQ4_9HYPH